MINSLPISDVMGTNPKKVLGDQMDVFQNKKLLKRGLNFKRKPSFTGTLHLLIIVLKQRNDKGLLESLGNLPYSLDSIF